MNLSFIDKFTTFGAQEKLVVFESDDWGALRAYSKIEGFNPTNVYDRLDYLESTEDIESLAMVLKKFKDSVGRHPILTANVATANPSVEKICDSGWTEYHYESVPDTFRKLRNDNTWGLWLDLVKDDLIRPQYHCREHINVPQFKNFLAAEPSPFYKELMMGHNFGFEVTGKHSIKNNFQVAWDYRNNDEKAAIFLSILDGLDMFENLYGFASRTVIAPSYTWNDEIEKILFDKGVRAMQGLRLRKNPEHTKNKNLLNNLRFLSTKRSTGMINLVRNVFFEPSHSRNLGAASCLKRINFLMKHNIPVIIGSHRVNFMGGGDSQNRLRNLNQLEFMLEEMIGLNPDIKFVSSDELIGKLYGHAL